MSERHFRRLRDRYEAEGAEGIADKRLGRASARRAPVDEVAWVVEMFRTRHWDFTAKHFHEVMVRDQGLKRGYTWTKTTLQRAGLRPRAVRRSAHRKKRLRRPLEGMLLWRAVDQHGVVLDVRTARRTAGCRARVRRIWIWWRPWVPIGTETGPPVGVQKGPLLSLFFALVPVANRRGPRVTRSAFRGGGAARGGGGLFAHRGKCGDAQPRFLNRQDSLPVSMISQ